VRVRVRISADGTHQVLTPTAAPCPYSDCGNQINDDRVEVEVLPASHRVTQPPKTIRSTGGKSASRGLYRF